MNGLLDLRLTGDDLAGLTQQGFVSQEVRGNRGPYFKLRFRSGGRQRVRYLGSDPQLAERIAYEVSELQAPHRLEQELVRIKSQASRLLRKSKLLVTKTLDPERFKFHGFAIRRRRPTKPGPIAT